jgi:hypothetical protein
MPYNRVNLNKRIIEVCEYAYQYHEAGRLDRSWAVIWRIYVNPRYHISMRTFRRYLRIDRKTREH